MIPYTSLLIFFIIHINGVFLVLKMITVIRASMENMAQRQPRKKELSANDAAPGITENDPGHSKTHAKDHSLFGNASELFNNKKDK